ncbi:MAG: alginate O-acetyltransferase AlgX-related protein [Vicinamibacteria bacterium]
MPDSTLQHNREELARQEVGHTQVGRGIAWLLAAQFLFAIVCVPVSEVLPDLHRMEQPDTLSRRLARLVETAFAARPAEGAVFSRIASRNRAVITELEQFEDGVEDASRLGQWLRPPVQYVLARFGAGNEQVYIGLGPWLFFRESLDYLSGHSVQPEALPAILHLKKQLNARGIDLIVVPAPVKPTVHPEHFTGRVETTGDPLRPAPFRDFVRELERHGVLVFDPAPVLLEAKHRTGQPQYLMTDTHWRPEAGELVAAGLRDFVIEHADLPPTASSGYVSETGEVRNLGDIARLLDLPEDQTLYPEETVPLRQIRTTDGAPWRPSRSAHVLLLGDSFSNIYSLGEMGWGVSAGLPAQLAFLLQRPVDSIIQNADGAFAAREALARELGGGEDRLAGKRLVIFQFAERELAVGDWKQIELELGDTAPGQFFVPGAGEQVIVTGTIREVAPVPRPETVPYEDHITAVHLVDLESERAAENGGEALVYMWGMRDRVLQDAARFRAGDRITVQLRPWSDVASLYDGVSRTELENEAVQFEEPTWGEVD